jgi:hypothetical protein
MPIASLPHPAILPSRAKSSAVLRLGALALLVITTPHAIAELSPYLPPGGNFALGNWKLTIPADENGEFIGKAITILPERLVGPDGYSSPWMYTASDGAMTFCAPVNGATTGITNAGKTGSPRAELR